MSQPERQENDDQLINTAAEIFTSNTLKEAANQRNLVQKLQKLQRQVLSNDVIFSDDVCFEIISMIDDSCFILQNCSLISKQFFHVIKERAKLVIQFNKNLTEKRIELCMKSQFVNSIVNVKFSCWLLQPIEKLKFISEMKQLTLLDIYCNQVGVEGAKSISEMKQLTSLNISNNEIGDKGANFISGMKQLTSLNIGSNEIGNEGVKSISEMKQLTLLDICYNGAGVEGANSIRWIRPKLLQAHQLLFHQHLTKPFHINHLQEY